MRAPPTLSEVTSSCSDEAQAATHNHQLPGVREQQADGQKEGWGYVPVNQNKIIEQGREHQLAQKQGYP